MTSDEYKHWETGNIHSVSLFLEKIPNDRTCDDLSIPTYFCSCLRYYNVSPETYGDRPPTTYAFAPKLLAELSSTVIQQINEESYTSLNNYRGQIC